MCIFITAVRLTLCFLTQIEHFTSFEEMKKRDDHICPKDDMATYMDQVLAKEEGGFFRKGKWANFFTKPLFFTGITVNGNKGLSPVKHETHFKMFRSFIFL